MKNKRGNLLLKSHKSDTVSKLHSLTIISTRKLASETLDKRFCDAILDDNILLYTFQMCLEILPFISDHT